MHNKVNQIKGVDGSYLRAKLNIGRYNSDFDDGHDADKADYTQKTKNVVIATLIQPQAPENKEQFDEDYKKRYQPCEENTINTLVVPQLFWNLARHAVRFRRMLVCGAVVETIPTPNIDKRQLNE